MTPKGEHPISVCLGAACYVRGAEKVLDELKRQLGINVGEVTPDGKFSLTCLRCVGVCGLARARVLCGLFGIIIVRWLYVIKVNGLKYIDIGKDRFSPSLKIMSVYHLRTSERLRYLS